MSEKPETATDHVVGVNKLVQSDTATRTLTIDAQDVEAVRSALRMKAIYLDDWAYRLGREKGRKDRLQAARIRDLAEPLS